MKTTEYLEQELTEVRQKIEECFEFLHKDLPDDKKERLMKAYTKLETERDRIAIALDILNGRAFLIHEHNGQLSIIKPSEKTAKLLAVAEQYGGKVTKYEEE